MSTKYPTDYDDTTTLGPLKIDVSPPTDPQRNIAAEYRNNMDDAIVAIQTRLGKLEDTANSSVDWGLLTISGNPNQGVRFAGSHAVWPGVVAEDGIFVDSSSGNVAFHKSGDPVGTFTDLTGGGGVGTWDDLYAASKTMGIGAGNPLTWTQTVGTGVGFIVQKLTNTATASVMQVKATDAAFPAGIPILEVSRASGGDVALGVEGFIHFTGEGKVYTNASSEALTIQTTGALSPININTSASYDTCDITIDGGISDVNILTSNLGRVDVVGGSNGIILRDAPLYIDVTAVDWDLGAAGCEIYHNGAPSTYGFHLTMNGAANLSWDHASANRIKTGSSHLTIEVTGSSKDLHSKSARDIFFHARGSDPISVNDAADINLSTVSDSIVGAINELAGNLGVHSWNELYGTGTQMDITGATMVFNANIATSAFKVKQTSTGDVVAFDNSAKTLTAVDVNGKLSITPVDPTTATFLAADLVLASGNLSAAVAMVGYNADISASASDDSSSIIQAFRATLRPSGTPASTTGYYADDNWGFGLHLESRAYLSDGSTATTTTALTAPLLIDSDPPNGDAAIIACNGASNADSLFLAFIEGTLDVPTTLRLTIRNDGAIRSVVDSASSGLRVQQEYSGGTSELLKLEDLNAPETRFEVEQNGTITQIANTSSYAFTITQNGSGGLLNCKDGIVDRLTLSQTGVATISAAGATTDPCARLDQTTNNAIFMRFDGNSAADYDASTSTLNGDGSVVGPNARVASDGWAFAGMMLKVQVGINTYWVPLFVADPVP